MRKNILTGILILDFLCAVVVVITLYISGITEGLLNDLYGVLFLGFIPLVGGINGLIIARRWGGTRSAVGRGIWFLSLGLISWALGTYIFSGVYNFLLDVEVPYPSFADVGYVLSLPLWIIGIVELSRATGAQYGLRSSQGKMLFLLVPVTIVAISYYLLVVVARGGSFDFTDSDVLKIFFDLAYPLGDVFILSLATLVYGLSYNYFGGIYKRAIYLILFGFILMYFADFSFSYTTTLGTWHPGDWVDLLFTAAMLVLSIGISMLDPKKSDQSDFTD